MQLGAGACIVNANRVRGGEMAFLIGGANAATVLGNITTGAINLNGATLAAPWDALNVRG